MWTVDIAVKNYTVRNNLNFQIYLELCLEYSRKAIRNFTSDDRFIPNGLIIIII